MVIDNHVGLDRLGLPEMVDASLAVHKYCDVKLGDVQFLKMLQRNVQVPDHRPVFSPSHDAAESYRDIRVKFSHDEVTKDKRAGECIRIGIIVRNDQYPFLAGEDTKQLFDFSCGRRGFSLVHSAFSVG